MNYQVTTTKSAGSYQIGGAHGLHVHLSKRPMWLHRVMMRLCLGWEWVDA